jgi:hypothetical protein
MKTFFREPLVHFLLIGAGLFLLFGWRGGPAPLPAGQAGPSSGKVVVSRDDIARMTESFSRTWQRPPTEEEAKGLVEDFVRNEIYYREGLAIGLDRDDGVIRRRMRQKMEFILEDITAQTEPTEEELLAYMKKHPDSYLVDPKIAFRHVYVNAARRGKSADTEALGILARLDAGADPDAVGDPFLLASEVPLSPLWDISKQFGEPFSRKLLELKPNSWAGPVQSGYGLHLVLVRKRVGSRLAELKDAREAVKRDVMVERQKELKDAAYAKLRERYAVTVEKEKGDKKTASTVVGGGARQ